MDKTRARMGHACDEQQRAVYDRETGILVGITLLALFNVSILCVHYLFQSVPF